MCPASPASRPLRSMLSAFVIIYNVGMVRACGDIEKGGFILVQFFVPSFSTVPPLPPVAACIPRSQGLVFTAHLVDRMLAAGTEEPHQARGKKEGARRAHALRARRFLTEDVWPLVGHRRGSLARSAVVLAVWALNARLNGAGKRSLRWTRQHLAAERADLTRAFNLRELLRRSVHFTSWVAHGLVDRDHIEDLMLYEGRGRSPWSEHADAVLTLCAFYAEGLPQFKRLPPSKQAQVVAVPLRGGPSGSGGPGGASQAGAAVPQAAGLEWRAVVLDGQRVALATLATHNEWGAAGGWTDFTGASARIGRNSGGHPVPAQAWGPPAHGTDAADVEGATRVESLSGGKGTHRSERMGSEASSVGPLAAAGSRPQEAGGSDELTVGDRWFRHMAAGLVALRVGVASRGAGGSSAAGGGLVCFGGNGRRIADAASSGPCVT